MQRGRVSDVSGTGECDGLDAIATAFGSGLVLLPLFILSQNHRFNTVLILRYYALATTSILVLCLVRFVIFYPELFNKYLICRPYQHFQELPEAMTLSRLCFCIPTAACIAEDTFRNRFAL